MECRIATFIKTELEACHASESDQNFGMFKYVCVCEGEGRGGRGTSSETPSQSPPHPLDNNCYLASGGTPAGSQFVSVEGTAQELCHLVVKSCHVQTLKLLTKYILRRERKHSTSQLFSDHNLFKHVLTSWALKASTCK